jgi:hypothetical protein
VVEAEEAEYMAINHLTAERLQALAELYRHGQESDLMDRALEKLLRHEAEQSQAQLSQLGADLAQFERRYELPSDEFYQRFEAGQMGDDMDYVEWASLVQMANNLKQRLKLLQASEPA